MPTPHGPWNRFGNTSPAFVREPLFDNFILTLAQSNARMEEMDRAIEWALMRNPTRFRQVQEGYFLWKFSPVEGFPTLEILYRYDEETNTVFLIRARTVPE